MRLERLNAANAGRQFMEHEFNRLDIDGSGGIELPEFTQYVSNMTSGCVPSCWS